MKRYFLLLTLAIMALMSACMPVAASEPLYITHPDDASRQVEYFAASPAGQGPWPTVVLLHGHQEGQRPGGKSFADWGVLKELAGQGYLAVAISQPGYGKSTGPADFCGPLTQHAVSAVIARLKSEGQIAPGKLLIEGISRGALVAGLLAAHDPSIAGLVLISGTYDLQAYVNDASSGLARQSIIHTLNEETGGTPAALAARSVLAVAGSLKMPVLILNGARDDRAMPDQGKALADAINQNGGQARVIIYPEFGHNIPVAARNKDIAPFLANVLGAPVH